MVHPRNRDMAGLRIGWGPLFYGATFVVALPAMLWVWAWSLADRVTMPLWDFGSAEWIPVCGGLVLMIWGMADLFTRGRGLPMNAFPPPVFVRTGLYGWLKHPIYVGAGFFAVGSSLIANSSAGFHVVSPIFIFGMMALVYGYEGPDLRRRFPERGDQGPIIGISGTGYTHPTIAERVGLLMAIFLPWAFVYSWVIFQGEASGSVETVTGWEASLPVVEWMEFFYVLIYPWLFATPFVLKDPAQLRRAGVVSLWASVVGLFLQVVLPFHASHRPFSPQSFWGQMIEWERSVDGTTASFPSFHVIWAVVGAVAWSWRWPRLKILWILLAASISANCVAIGVHSVADVVAGVVVGLIACRYDTVFRKVLDAAEYLANSWREWHFGPIRVINHAIYPAIGAAAGLLIMSLYVESPGAVFCLLCLGIIGAGLWGQWLEGAGKLARPFGYYGSVLGVATMVWPVAAMFHTSWHQLAGAFVLAAPWIQLIGRARCLVQGCCHGAPVGAQWGIRHHHPNSRVHRISGLSGVPLHATALYSMISNAFIGVLLIRLVWSGADTSWIIGCYLMLSGVSRFVEEAWRGEAQTAVVKGLRIYQWLAIVSLLVGMFITTIDGELLTIYSDRAGMINRVLGALPWSVAAAALSAAAMGVDFPRSRMRFGRLA